MHGRAFRGPPWRPSDSWSTAPWWSCRPSATSTRSTETRSPTSAWPSIWLKGSFWEAVSGTWSPMLSWCIAPLIALGVDGLHACRIVPLAWGAGLVLACALLLERFPPMTRTWQLVTIGLIASMAAHWAIAISQPDMGLAALLMAYFWCVLDPRLLHSRRRQLACGILGGVAYLTKAYARLPFFLVHYAFVLTLRGYQERRQPQPAGPRSSGPRRSWRLPAGWAAVGALGLAVVAGPWIGVLSIKQGTFTISAAGAMNRSFVAPADMPPTVPVNQSLRTPPEGEISVWEHLEYLPSPASWSPLDSRARLIHQLKVVGSNLWRLVDMVRGYDLFCFAIALVAVLPIVALGLRGSPGGWFRPLWLAGTFLLYCSGYMLMYIDARYLLPVLVPLGWIYCVSVANLLQSHWQTQGRGARSHPVPRAWSWWASSFCPTDFRRRPGLPAIASIPMPNRIERRPRCWPQPGVGAPLPPRSSTWACISPSTWTSPSWGVSCPRIRTPAEANSICTRPGRFLWIPGRPCGIPSRRVIPTGFS